MACTPKKFKCCSICSLVGFVIFLVLAIVLPIVIENTIADTGRQKAIMQVSNQNLWGEVPGDTQANVTRQFFFYNFTNPEGFLYNNENPEFYEVGPYVYQEYQNFSNYNYKVDPKTNQRQIKYDFYNYFKYLSGNVSDRIQTVNLGTAGVWAQAKTAPKKKVAVQAFSSIIYTLEDYLYLIACSQGIYSQFIKDKENLINTVFKPAGLLIPSSLYDILWGDEKFGWGTWSTLRKWITAAKNGYYSDEAYLIRDYFELSYEQLLPLLGPLKEWNDAVGFLIQDWYCQGHLPCDGLYLTALQMTSQGVTTNPPAGTILPTPSIVTNNDTLRGYPEISLFLQKVFLQNQTYNNSNYTNITFPTLWAYKLFNHSNDSKNWTKNDDIILHVGNLGFIFSEGEIFDNSGKNLSLLIPLQKRFHLNSTYQAHVFYEWVTYITDEFAIQKSKNGTSATAAIGTFLSNEIYKRYNSLNGYLLMELLSNMMLYNITQEKLDCKGFFIASSLNSTQAENVCQRIPEFNNSWLTTKPMRLLINLCWYRNDQEWANFTNKTSINDKNLQFICDSDLKNRSSFNAIKTYADKRIHTQYQCQNTSSKCSQTEITAKQWGNSTITRHVLDELKTMNKKFVNADSVSDWEPTLFPKVFEYYAIIKKFPNFTTNNTVVGFDTETSRRLLTYERLFNQMIRYVINDYNLGNTTSIDNLFKINDMKALYHYLKYSMIELAFQGFSQIRTVDELLWGYQDDFLHTTVKDTDPQKGGDPSVNDIVSLSTNFTAESSKNNTQTVFSGESDISNVRVYNTIFNLSYITFNDTDFNGNESYVKYTNPWQEEVAFNGTDSFGNAPGLTQNSKLKIYVGDLSRGGYGECHGEIATYNGVDTLRFRLVDAFMANKTTNPDNEKYFMDKWNGALNLTAVKKIPLFVSKFHYLDLDSEAFKNVKLYKNASLNEEIKATRDDDVVLDIEPYSGAGLRAALNIQTNYEYTQDSLYSNDKYSLLPIFGLKRSGQWSDGAIDTQFGLLKIALKLRLVFQIVFYILAGLLLILGAVMIYKYRKRVSVKTDTLLPTSNNEIDFNVKVKDIAKQ